MGRFKESVSSYIKHRFSVQSKYSLHSPFIYRFWAGILKDYTNYPAYGRVEKFRKIMLGNEKVIHRMDYGAGSDAAAVSGSKGSSGISAATTAVAVKELARNSSVSVAKGQFLYKLVKVNQPAWVLELGTSLGLSALYMAEAAPDAKIITLEGCIETAAIAKSYFETAGKKNITLLEGTFAENLDEALQLMPKPDFIFFDGDHRYESTLLYWEKCLPRLYPGSVVVFDDIHWSAGMEKAWKHIISSQQVKVSIDLYYLGIVFFREELSKEDFVLRF